MHAARLSRRLPPQRLITAVNPLVRGLLASPLHGSVDSSLMTMHVTGRRTGRSYDVPVGYVDVEGRLFVVTQHRWRVNLRGGCEVDVTRCGRRTRMRAELDEEPQSVARTLRMITERLGWRATRRLTGLRAAEGQHPTLEDLEDAARTYDLAVVTLEQLEQEET